jgi:ubiquinone biosynthesis protein
LEFGFFHADPHAGNIMALPDGRIAFIDLGAMGVIYAADQELLEDVILNLVARNVPRLVTLLKKMAIRIDIPDERKLHQDLSDMLAMVDASGLGQLNVGLLMGKFKDVLFENRIVMPDYFTLLVRGLVLIESVGRTLDPSMNVLAGVAPYVAKIVRKRMSPEYLFNKGITRLGELGHDLQQLPDDLRSILQRLNEGELTIAADVRALDRTHAAIRRGFQLTALAVVLGAGMVATALLYAARPDAGQWAWVGVVGCAGLGGVLFLQMLKR